jgi:hypothetical protein
MACNRQVRCCPVVLPGPRGPQGPAGITERGIGQSFPGAQDFDFDTLDLSTFYDFFGPFVVYTPVDGNVEVTLSCGMYTEAIIGAMGVDIYDSGNNLVQAATPELAVMSGVATEAGISSTYTQSSYSFVFQGNPGETYRFATRFAAFPWTTVTPSGASNLLYTDPGIIVTPIDVQPYPVGGSGVPGLTAPTPVGFTAETPLQGIARLRAKTAARTAAAGAAAGAAAPAPAGTKP